jgi:peptidoglycan DL-endopeptidase CwlO
MATTPADNRSLSDSLPIDHVQFANATDKGWRVTLGLSRRHLLRWALCALAFLGLAVSPLVVAAPARAAQHNAVPRHILRAGSTGQLVVRMQKLLGVPADGMFGPGTRRRVMRFQRRHHLLADGRVGRHTWRALVAVHDRHIRHHLNDGILRLGDRGAAVHDVQRLLRIRANWVYDRRTLRVVRRFQRHHGLIVDGETGPHTLRGLQRRAAQQAARAGHRHHGSLGTRAARLSHRYAGIRYAWGGATPSQGFDCSGLVQYVYGRLGVELPRVTYDQWHAGRHVRRADLRPGDLVFFHNLGHVGIFLGHGWLMSAPHTGGRVHASRLQGWYKRHYEGAVRISQG